MQIAKQIVKCLLLAAIGISVAVLWLYGHSFLPQEFISRGGVAATAERFSGIATLMVIFSAPALPIYRLFREHAVIAAIFVGWMPLLLSTALAFQVNSVFQRPFSISLAIAEGISCWVALVLGAWAVKSRASVSS